MVENFFFEMEHYGAVLNANRTYYLTRSQPPFLTSMILAVYDAQKAAGKEDRAWLERAYGYATRDHGLWEREPPLAGGNRPFGSHRFWKWTAPGRTEGGTGDQPPSGGVFSWAATGLVARARLPCSPKAGRGPCRAAVCSGSV